MNLTGYTDLKLSTGKCHSVFCKRYTRSLILQLAVSAPLQTMAAVDLMILNSAKREVVQQIFEARTKTLPFRSWRWYAGGYAPATANLSRWRALSSGQSYKPWIITGSRGQASFVPPTCPVTHRQCGDHKSGATALSYVFSSDVNDGPMGIAAYTRSSQYLNRWRGYTNSFPGRDFIRATLQVH